MNSISVFSCIVSQYCGIARPWIGDTSNPLYKKYNSFNTGICINGDGVYSYTTGTVIAVGHDDDGYAVSIQYDAFTCLRYTHLLTTTVSAGDQVQSNSFIGYADKFVRFEYATTAVSNWPVRIGTQTYYKHDPADMLRGD